MDFDAKAKHIALMAATIYSGRKRDDLPVDDAVDLAIEIDRAVEAARPLRHVFGNPIRLSPVLSTESGWHGQTIPAKSDDVHRAESDGGYRGPLE